MELGEVEIDPDPVSERACPVEYLSPEVSGPNNKAVLIVQSGANDGDV